MNNSNLADFPNLSWVGFRIDDCVIEQELSSGAFSSVYKALKADGSHVAFKVSKPPGSREHRYEESVLESAALMQITGGMTPVIPDNAALLRFQFQAMISAPAGSFPATYQCSEHASLVYYQMEYLNGPTFTELANQGPIKLSLLIEVVNHLQILNNAGIAHGDLKPSNMVCKSDSADVRLIDPGYFGTLSCEGMELPVIVSTPAYYPTLEADDCLAFVLSLWELVCGFPILGHAQLEKQNAEPGLLHFIQGFQMVGNYYLDGLKYLRRPSFYVPSIDPIVEMFLLLALGLQATASGTLEKTGKHAELPTLKKGLDALVKAGLTHL